MPGREEFYTALFALHKRLLAGDPTLLGDIAKLVFEPLIAHLRHEIRNTDDHLLQEKAADAVIEYGKNPSQANATGGAGVMGFLVMRAKSRVFTGIRKERRHEEVKERYANELGTGKSGGKPVELRLVPGEHYPDNPSDSAAHEASSDPVERLDLDARVNEVLAGAKTKLDQQVLEMMMAGVRATSEYARVLGIEDRPLEEQRRIVKQHKDRLKAAGSRRQEAKRSGPKRRGRPSRRRDAGGGSSD